MVTVKRDLLLLVCAVLLLETGCPRRQTASRLVYISVPPSASAPNVAPATGSIVIEEPQPPEEEAKTTEPMDVEPETTPKRVVRHRRTGAIRPDTPAEAEDTPAAPQAPPPAGVPALEPQQPPEKQAQLRREIAASREDTERRLAQLDHMTLGAGDRKTLDDARSFLAQSARALEEGELVRSINLARKAALLVSAVEQSH
ncbi:MAG TPA: hypothetical protein VG204_06265 [Terriglobia bacterium]|nr:hypothetical protein [Terriglobia bacterium]